MIVVAKNLSVLQLFISRMPKMCAILQLVSAPLNPIPIAEHFRRSNNDVMNCRTSSFFDYGVFFFPVGFSSC